MYQNETRAGPFCPRGNFRNLGGWHTRDLDAGDKENREGTGPLLDLEQLGDHPLDVPSVYMLCQCDGSEIELYCAAYYFKWSQLPVAEGGMILKIYTFRAIQAHIESI